MRRNFRQDHPRAFAVRAALCSTSSPRIMILALICAFMLVASLSLSACAPAQTTDEEQKRAYKTELMNEGTLKVLTTLDYPPFAAGSAEDAWGYDIAVAHELADRLGLSLELVPTTRETIIETLACELPSTASAIAGKEEETSEPQGDIAIAAIAITGERDEKVDFSDWYYVGNQAVVVRKGAYQSTAEFDPKKTRIAVVKGSTCLETAKALTDEDLVAEYSTAQRCLQALQAKEVQAVVLDLPVATYLIDNSFADLRIIERVMTGEAYGIAVPSQSPQLKDAINEALSEMEEDGTLARLQEEYIGSSY